MLAVKVLRIVEGDTQEELSNYLGCTVSTYNRKENGKNKFTLEELKKITKKYNVSLEKIVNTEVVKKEILNLFCI